jgi:hypothetical protein
VPSDLGIWCSAVRDALQRFSVNRVLSASWR